MHDDCKFKFNPRKNVYMSIPVKCTKMYFQNLCSNAYRCPNGILLLKHFFKKNMQDIAVTKKKRSQLNRNLCISLDSMTLSVYLDLDMFSKCIILNLQFVCLVLCNKQQQAFKQT